MTKKQKEEIPIEFVEEENDEAEESEKDEESLEEHVLDETPVDTTQLRRAFSQGAPVLEQVEVAPHIEGLEQGLVREPSPKPVNDETKDSFHYRASNENGEEKEKYKVAETFQDTTMIPHSRNIPSLVEIGRKNESWGGQEINAMAEMKKMIGDSHDDNDYIVKAQRFDEKNLDPLGKKQYDPHNKTREH